MGTSQVSLIKHTFFNPSPAKKKHISFKEDDFHLRQLAMEFSSLYQLFISNKPYWTNDNEIISCLYYMCNALILYYQYDYVNADLQALKKKKEEIELFIKNNFSVKKQHQINEFSVFLLEKLKAYIAVYTASSDSASDFIKRISNVNTYRSHWSYSRALATFFLNYIQKSNLSDFIQKLNIILGCNQSFADGINLLNESREALTLMGIILYLLRFMINLILIIKHVIQAALHEDLSVKKVLIQELEKRVFTMASDFVWASINLLTTYNNFFRVSAEVVPPLILAFLIFDIVLFFIQLFFELKKYEEQIQELITQKPDATALELAVIQRQIEILHDEWEVQKNYYLVNILGAHILAISFAVSIFCTGPFALAGVVFFSMLGNALYNTTEEYKKYQQTRVALQREQINGKTLDDEHHQMLVKELDKLCNQHCLEFWKTLVYNVGGTAFIITAAVISWPIALGITMAYLAYQLNSAYQKQLNNDPAEFYDVYRMFHLVPSEQDRENEEPSEYLSLGVII